MPNYGDLEYWEARYKDQINRTFDWLQDYQYIKPFISSYLSQSHNILHIGCGNSLLSEDLHSDGYSNLYNIDFSEEVISQMSKRTTQIPSIHWAVMDVRSMTFKNNFFDVVIDKCTLDTFLCTNCSYTNTARMTKEVQRVLKAGGVFLVISCGIPDERVEFLQWKHLAWNIESTMINEGSNTPHFLYVCKKKENADEVCLENWESTLNALKEEEDEDALYSDDETSEIQVNQEIELEN